MNFTQSLQVYVTDTATKLVFVAKILYYSLEFTSSPARLTTLGLAVANLAAGKMWIQNDSSLLLIIRGKMLIWWIYRCNLFLTIMQLKQYEQGRSRTIMYMYVYRATLVQTIIFYKKSLVHTKSLHTLSSLFLFLPSNLDFLLLPMNRRSVRQYVDKNYLRY